MPVEAVLALLTALLNQAGTISTILQKAKADNRDTLTPEEWQQILGADDSALSALQKAIASKAGHGDST
jgi:hypothetical protein